MSHHFVQAENLDYVYPDGHPALRQVSFRITHGESVAIIGANGAGKSTLLQTMVAHLLPTSGIMNIGGHPVTARTAASIRQSIGLTFQNPDDQLFMPTVFDDVAFGPLNQDLPEEEVRRRVDDALETVGAAHLKERPPYRLSGGEKRAVTIACVLSMQPDILVMDEPSAGLDPRSRRRLINLLRSFTHTRIIATHDLELVLELCERSIILHEGRVFADGKTVDIMNDPALLESAGLETPASIRACPKCSQPIF